MKPRISACSLFNFEMSSFCNTSSGILTISFRGDMSVGFLKNDMSLNMSNVLFIHVSTVGLAEACVDYGSSCSGSGSSATWVVKLRAPPFFSPRRFTWTGFPSSSSSLRSEIELTLWSTSRLSGVCEILLMEWLFARRCTGSSYLCSQQQVLQWFPMFRLSQVYLNYY